jgi:Tfp pilus assembly major pilin PilA
MVSYYEGYMKSKSILLGLSFLMAASMACSLGARQVSPTATPIAIMPPTEVAATASQAPVSTELTVQAPTALSNVFPATVVPTLPASVSQPGEIRQWASSAAASSEYGSPDWAAARATGAPDVTACGDDVNAWASSNDTTVEWLELTYATPVKPFEINIYQTYNPGQIVKVELFSPDGKTVYHVYTATPVKVDTCPQVLTLPLDGSNLTQVNRIRITVDQSVLGVGWAEIDAVELVGVK